MMFGHHIGVLAVLAVGAHQVAAQYTSVYLPGFDVQAVSMTEAGAADGTTTFLLGAGTPTDSDEPTFPTDVTLTYVVGPSAVAWYGAMGGQNFGDYCQIGSDQMATCVESGAQGRPPMTMTEAYAKGFPVQFAAPTGAPSGTTATSSAAAGSVSSSTTSSSNGNASGGLSSNSASTSAASTSPTTNVSKGSAGQSSSSSGSSAPSATASNANGAAALASASLTAITLPIILTALTGLF